MHELNPTRARLQETFGLDQEMIRGNGCRLWDSDGNEYLDFLSQYGALPFGHNPEDMWAAIHDVHARSVPVMLQPLRALEAEDLAHDLASITPGDLNKVMLANSGAEAVEAAIKLARARTGRDIILSTENSFHGKTLGALSATGKDFYQRDFGGPAQGFDYLPFGDLHALEERLARNGNRIAAFLVEPIQGEGGVICPPAGYLDAALALCRKHGVLSIVDEIQTGLGRTGRLFACGSCEEVPDMLLLGKALGGGLMPISACIVREDVWDDRFGALHSSTFANSNLACSVARAAIHRLLQNEQALISSVATNGAYFRDQLESLRRRFPNVLHAVRGEGYMEALEFCNPVERGRSATLAFCGLNGGFIALLSSYLLNVERIVTAPVFNDTMTLRLQPPLVTTRADLDQCLGALAKMCDLLDREAYGALVRHLVAPWRRARMKPSDLALPLRGPSRNVPAATPGRFCFLIHYTQEADLLHSDPSFDIFTSEERQAWLQWVKRIGTGFAWSIPARTSLSGSEVEGMIMSVPLLPGDMTGKGRLDARRMIEGAVDMAAQNGAQRFGLGAFTSIVTGGGASVTGRGVPVTSGNTLTTVSAVTAIERVASRVGVDISSARVAVIGASGSIGRLASLMLARRVGHLTLVGNAQNTHATKLLDRVETEVIEVLAQNVTTMRGGRLFHAVDEWMRRGRVCASDDGINRSRPGLVKAFRQACQVRKLAPPLQSTTDINSACANADIVLVATSAEIALVDPANLRPGTIVCDVARPQNVAPRDLSDTGVIVFDGGLVQPPFTIDLGPFQTLPGNLCWGCLGETMLLTLEGETPDYSIGRDLSLREADKIAAMARRHGFEPAEPQWYGELLKDADFERVAAGVDRRSGVA